MQDYHGLIIFPLAMLTELIGSLENVLYERTRPEFGMAGSADGFSSAFEAEDLAVCISGFNDPIGAQYNAVAASQDSLEDFVRGIFPQPQGEVQILLN
jgi:hypothetical protein